MYDPGLFAEKYQLALQTAQQEKAEGGLCGFELEWNLLDSQFRPLLTVGSGPSQQSFVDYLRAECISPWLRSFSQLEVFHWMIEYATRPYYHPRGAVFEGRLLEASLHNALYCAGANFHEHLYAWPGNLPVLTPIGADSIPLSWHLAKRRYLERCVELYGWALATAGNHTNLSLPDPLFAWDFMHLSSAERRDYGSNAHNPLYLDNYKSEFYITATRLLRAFAALFVATSAATPFKAGMNGSCPVVLLTAADSMRNLTFPNPPVIDLPDLYRSYDDYLQISYDLVRRGVRFGNNNWTPVRARSFAEPVERLIAVTSEQLHDLYARGLYVAGQDQPVDEMAHQIEIQNLMARINLPMARVEVRTDDSGHSLEVDIANLTLKHLLLLRFYADPDFARAFRYDREDLNRARRNEEQAARLGLRAEIENPLTGKTTGMRDWLNWVIQAVRPLAVALNFWEDLTPLVEMAAGAPNTAERIRARLCAEMGVPIVEDQATQEVPLELLFGLTEEHQVQLLEEVEAIAETYPVIAEETPKLAEFLQHARDDVRANPGCPCRFRPRPEARVDIAYADKTSEVLALAGQLIRIPSVTTGPVERLDEVHRCATFVFDYLRDYGLEVNYYNQSKYPAVLAGFPGSLQAPVMLSGHFDVVPPEPDDSQFEPRLEGDYLWGRGAADMKTVAATYLVWIKDTLRQGPPYPPVNLLLVGNEENGEVEPMGTPHVLQQLTEAASADAAESSIPGKLPRLVIAGERTGENGDDLWGEICVQNRGVMRFDVAVRGLRGHTGVAQASVGKASGGNPAAAPSDLTERLLIARAAITGILGRHLTLSSPDSWQSQARFPFIQVGTPGVYNVTPDYGVLGVEVRPIPQDDIRDLIDELEAYCKSQSLELSITVRENGIACDADNPYLQTLVGSVRQVSGLEPRLGRKLPGTSARFAPGGQGVVWGQSGLGPHARNERHYIPSIDPYYRALVAFGMNLIPQESPADP
jgi:succinyl-diaminopimelate desuccinylase